MGIRKFASCLLISGVLNSKVGELKVGISISEDVDLTIYQHNFKVVHSDDNIERTSHKSQLRCIFHWLFSCYD
jgi:hypothetical protein